MAVTEIVKEHFNELAERYTGLQLLLNGQTGVVVAGRLQFTASYAGTCLGDAFDVEISFPEDYPLVPPVAREIGGRIPSDFHQSEGLCLGAPLGVRMAWAGDPTLLGFVERLLVPYLFSFACFEREGAMPYGELSHGGKGLLEFYLSLFSVNDPVSVLGLLQVLADDGHRGHLQCPCGRGKRLRDCHGPQLRKLCRYQTASDFMHDYAGILTVFKGDELPLPRKFVSKSLIKHLKRTRRTPPCA